MTLNSISILVDGSLYSGFVWLTIAAAALPVAALAVVAQALVRRLWSRNNWHRLVLGLIAVAATVGIGALGPSAVQTAANLVAGIGSPRRVVVCFMPTNHPVRDTAPAGVVLVSTTLAGLVLGRKSCVL